MHYQLKYILENYLTAKNETFKEHKVAKALRNDITSHLKTELVTLQNDTYKLSGSPGQGNWADIPWLAIFDKNITITATKGYYIVYLFTYDMSGVYLSLNQGWTFYQKTYKKDAKKNIHRVALMWQKKLATTLKDFTFEPIYLKAPSSASLATGYELGHICGKYYSASNLPSDITLINDLQNLLAVYREIAGHLTESIEITTNNLLTQYTLEDMNIELISWPLQNDLDKLIATNSSQSTLQLNPTQLNITINTSEQHTSVKSKKSSNYIAKEKYQTKLGLAGELMVLKYEENKLKNYGISKKVEHISKTIGDSEGYDVKSYDKDGNVKYIEVKTTTAGIQTPFFLSSNEIEFSRNHSANYCLYRIYDLDLHTGNGNLYILSGDISEILELVPKTFLATGNISLE